MRKAAIAFQTERTVPGGLRAFATSAAVALVALAGCESPEPNPRVHVEEPGVQHIEARGVTFGYFAEGAGPLVLMLHGFPDTPHTWDAIRPVVADLGYRVVTPFIKGYAPTSAPAAPEAYQAAEIGADILALIEALGYEEAILIGHDWGASTSYAATLLDPGRIRKLISVAIPHHGVASDPMFLWRARHFVYLTWPGAEQAFAADDFLHLEELYMRWSPLWAPGAQEFEPAKNALTVPESLVGSLNYYRALWLDGPPAPFLEEPVPVPTLAIAGLSDGIVTEAMWDQTPAWFTDEYVLVKLPGGHWVHRENEQEVIDAIVAFLD